VSTSTLYIPWQRRSSKALRPCSEGMYGWVCCAKSWQLTHYFTDLNRYPKPIQWTYTKTKLMAKFGTAQPTELAA
jgi:hypothetical protein